MHTRWRDDGGDRLTIRVRAATLDKYPAKSHARRVAEQLAVGRGVIVLAAAPSALYPDSDQPVVLRQDRYFYYLSGCNEPDCYVTYDIARDILGLWVPAIDKRRVVWSGRGSTVEEALARYDIDEAYYIEPTCNGEKKGRDGPQGAPILDNVLSHGTDGEHIYAMVGAATCRARTNESVRPAQERELKLQRGLDACRVIKDEHEISLIRRANEITAEAHRAVLYGLHGFISEAEVEAEYMRVCISRHAREQAYSPIVGSGPNASVLHYVNNDEDLDDRQMMVLDAGCEVSCYASDVTRGIPLNKRNPGTWPSEEAEEVYRLVEKVQEACISEMRPGKSFVEIARMAYDMTLDGLLDFGILQGDRMAIKEARTHLGFFPHGLGHHLGLEVHDVAPPALPPKSSSSTTRLSHSDIPHLPPMFDFAPSSLYSAETASNAGSAAKQDGSHLRPGMVVTVEPGVYFNDYLLSNFYLNDPKHAKFINVKVLENYMPVGGVRIEDDILITRDGYENLTTAPKGDAMLRCIRKGAESGRA
ncbi:hypothetical protein LTR53_000409 [Teratosphaeriaceae sp. CCFEE 6253]|nr:hypothetical protein LTR53_000409 [Teratosphaeriaceae sp. CCFEE 6253]